MKRRRILAILLSVIMLLGMMPEALAYLNPDGSTEHDHVWRVETNDSRPATCVEYGLLCEVCTLCYQTRYTDIPPTGQHTWVRENVDRQPTCTENGEMSHVCSVCGTFETFPIAALGHDWSNWVTVTEPTCTEAGQRQHICSRCGLTESESINALGHNYTNSTVTRQPTCSQEGERQARCSRCGRTVTESIARTAHTWGEWSVVQAPGPWTPGKEERTCSVCGAKESRDTYMEGTVLPGERSDNAKQLQEALNEAGYDCGKADGIVGNKTTAAIAAAEEAAGKPATGIGWPGLMDWLQGGGVTPATAAVDSFALWVDAPTESDAKAGETIPVTIHVKNTGSTTLFIGGYSWGALPNDPYSKTVDGENLDLDAIGAANGIMAPGVELTFTYNVMPTEAEIAAFQAIRQIGVGCLRYENGQYVGDNIPRSAEFVIALGRSPVPVDFFDSFIVWADAPTQSPAQAGETIPVTVHAKNTGNSTLQVGGLSYGAYSSDSGLSIIGAESLDEKNDKYDFAPGEELTFTYNVAPQEAEFLAGALTRKVSINCARVVDGQFASPFMDKDAAFTIALGAVPIVVQPNPAPAFGAGIDVAIENVDGQIFHVGDTVKATVRVTNTGSTVLNVTGYTMVDGNGNDRSGEGTTEWNYSSEPADARALEPGKHYFVDYYITATDVDGGFITRKFTATAIDNVGNAVSDTDETTLFMQSYTTSGTTATLIPLVPGNNVADNYPYLSLDGVTPEYVPLYPDDTYTVTLTASNIGEHDLRGLIIEAFKQGYNDDGTYAETSLGIVYNGGSTTVMPVKQNVVADYTYTVLPEDEGQIVNLAFKAKAADTVTTELVYSNPWVCEFEVEGGEQQASLSIEQIGAETYEDIGSTYFIRIPIRVTNTGSVKLDARYACSEDGDGNDTHLDADADSHMITSGNGFIAPGESFEEEYIIFVTPADVEKGVIERIFWNFGYPLTLSATADVYDDTVEIPSNKLDFEYDLRETPRDGMRAQLTLTLNGPASQPDGALGETLEVPLLTTNNGESEMVVYGSKYLDEAGNFVSTDHMDPGSESNYLLPGGSQHTTYQILVTQDDIDAGKIIRKVQRIGNRVVGAEDGFVAYEKDETGGDKVYETNWVDIEIPLRDSPADAMLFIEQSGPASQPDGALGEVIKVPYRATNTGDVKLSDYLSESMDENGAHVAEDSITIENGDPIWLNPGEYLDHMLYITVRPEDVDAGVIRRQVQDTGFVVELAGDGADVWMDFDNPVPSNVLDIEIPLRDVPTDGTGELTLEVTDVSKPDASLGEWVTATLKLTNTGDVNVFANNSCDWNPDDGWTINSGYVSDVNGGTGSPSPLQPGLYVTHDLSIFVTPKDVDAGQIEREVYFYGLKEGTEQNVVSNTEKITIRLRPTEDDGSYIDLELVPETVSPVFANVGDVVDAPLTLINHGNAPAAGNSLFYWYESGNLAYADDIDIGPGFFWLGANGGEDQQTYHATVTQDDIDKGVVIRTVVEGASRIIETEEGGHSDGSTVSSNEATIEIPLMVESSLIPPVMITVEPDLVLTMKQLTPPQAVYKDGQEIEYEWTLTNVGDADCDFAGLKLYYTNQAGNMVTADETFFGLDGREVLKANGGSKTDKGKITLDAANILSDGMIVVAFYGQGYYPNTTEVWVKSNTVQFEYSIDDNIWVPEPVKVELDKWEDSIRPYAKGYANGSDVWYGWSVSIPEDAVLYNFTLEDPMYDDHHGGHIVFIDGAFGYESNAALGYYYHTVTYPEAEAGSLTNTITASWDDPVTGERVSTSDSVTVPTFTFPPNPPVPPVYPPVDPPLPPEITHKPGTLDIVKIETSKPYSNDSFYLENELITYDIIVYNNSDETMYDIYVDDPLVIGINKTIGYQATLAPHGSCVFTFCYIVTDKDCDAGSVTNTATVFWTDSSGHGHSNTSNPVTSLTGWPDKTGGLVLTKVEASKPANGSYYTEGETIGYKIHATNNSKRVLTDVEVYDLLSDMGMTPIGTAELLHPTEVRTFIFSHIVTAEDVKRGYVENFAVGFYTDDKTYGNISESNHVISDTDGQPDDTTHTAEGFNLPAGAADCCSLALNGKGAGTGDYTQHICTEHLPVAQQVDALVSAASDKNARTMAWKTARALWQAKIDEMYEVIYAAAKDLPTRLIVLNERMMFAAQSSLYEEELALLYPNDEETVAMKLAELTMNKSVELCYVIHTAPGSRVDSLLGSHAALADAADTATCARAILERKDADTRYIETLCKAHAATDKTVLDQLDAALKLEKNQQTEAIAQIFAQARKLWLAQLDAGVNDRYRAADNNGRKVIAANRTTFGNWLHTYEELLSLFYPQNDGTVNEVVARTIMNRTIDECIVDADAPAR